MSEEITFANLLKSLRVRKGTTWTQASTAEELQVSRRLYVGWENGESIPSHRDLKKIVTLFGLNKEDEDALYRAASLVPPKIHNLPFPQNPFFTGRERQLKQLSQLLKENGSVALTQPISISGLGGIGKTQLALEYAHRSYPETYRAVLWVNAADGTTLQASYDSLAHTLELPERNEDDPDQRIRAVKRWLEGYTSWLLIMDNADDLQLARSFLPAKPLGHVVLTTRSQIVGNIGRQIAVDDMEPEEGLVFLLRRSGVLQDETGLDTVAAGIRETALQVVELLGVHPLALDQAGAYIEETGISFPDYLKLYQENRRFLLNRHGSLEGEHSEHPVTVAVTFEISLIKARERHPMAIDILHFCSLLQPDAIPEELFLRDNSFRLSMTIFNEGVTALRRYSLVKRNMQEKTFSIHRLVQAVVIDAMSPDLRKQWRERVVRAVHASFPEPVAKNYRECIRLLPHALICAQGEETDLVPTLEASELLHKLGVWLRRRGRYAEAAPILSRTVVLQERFLGVEHLDIAVTIHDLAYVYHKQREYGRAEPLYRRALAIREKQLGAEDSLTHLSRASLWAMQNDRDRIDPIRQLQFAIRFAEEELGETYPPLTGEMREDYAKFLRRRERDAEAAALEVNDEPSV